MPPEPAGVPAPAPPRTLYPHINEPPGPFWIRAKREQRSRSHLNDSAISTAASFSSGPSILKTNPSRDQISVFWSVIRRDS